MKAIKSGLVVLVMTLALVSSGQAFSLFSYNDNSAVSADPAGHFPTGSPFPCIVSPAYPDYANARAISCPVDEETRRVPMHVGGPGL